MREKTLAEIANHAWLRSRACDEAPPAQWEAVVRAVISAVNARDELYAALEMVRDADEDCKRDGLPAIPATARLAIDAALAKARGESAR